MKRELSMLLGGWVVLAAFLFGVGWQNLSSPGLYYDEAVFGGLAKDFLSGRAAGPHLPGVHTVEIDGRPFPLFVQPHIGALKCWLLIPAFKLFGPTIAVLRGTHLVLEAVALLVCMIWMWRLLGLAEALLTGLLLASDPAFLFSGVLDWGSVLPGLLCLLFGLWLALFAWRRQNARLALASGLAFGLGIFNRTDFCVVVAGLLLAVIYAGGRAIRPAMRARPALFFGALFGLLAGAGLAFVSLGKMFPTTVLQGKLFTPAGFPETLKRLGSVYDGSYFYRLIDAGGMFDKMHQTSPPVWTPFQIVILLAAIVLLVDITTSLPENPARRTKIFLLLSTVFITLGTLILPGELQIQRVTLVFPLPHVLVASAVMALWRRFPAFSCQRPAFAIAAALAGLVIICNCLAVQRTEQLIHGTGGRGCWSNQLGQFAAEAATRPDVTVVSLDWGFNEQLDFLAQGSRLAEPYRQVDLKLKGEFPHDPRFIYLVHPQEYSISPVGADFMESVTRYGTNAVVKPWSDGQGRVAFYSVTFKSP